MADWLSLRARGVSASGAANTVMIMIVISLLSDQTIAKPQCKPGWYYDTVTGNCDHCSDICDQSKAMETVKECERKCPGYRRAGRKEKVCPPQQYYDDKVERCHTCDSLCVNAEITGTENDCNNLCPDWSGRKEASTKSSGNDSAVHRESEGGIAQSPLLNVDVANILVPVFALILSLLVAFLLTACIVWYRKRRSKLPGNPCNKRPHQVQQQESCELESLTAGGHLLSHPQTEDG